ncbi:MAG: quinolinate synthase NadA [Bacilli bacterium]
MSNFIDVLNQDSKLPERYSTMTVEELEQRVTARKKELGSSLFLPCHHYQKDEVVQFADAVGDSLQLAQVSAQNTEADWIVFCGVHFMAETADILTGDHQRVILPDMRAGCSMADMASERQVKRAWELLVHQYGPDWIPLTYVNSTASIKAFVGEHGGATVTSSNAHKIVKWALDQNKRLLFLPDQHLGRNTAFDLGIPLEEMAVYNPHTEMLEQNVEGGPLQVVLWKGHCSVHENFNTQQIENIRIKYPEMHVIVHPECSREVVAASDSNGSTKFIIDAIESAPTGSSFAVGTEMNLVNRLIQQHPDKHIVSVNPYMCPCLTMNRIDLPHLAWTLDCIAEGRVQNIITVDKEVAKQAQKALDVMLSVF